MVQTEKYILKVHLCCRCIPICFPQGFLSLWIVRSHEHSLTWRERRRDAIETRNYVWPVFKSKWIPLRCKYTTQWIALINWFHEQEIQNESLSHWKLSYLILLSGLTNSCFRSTNCLRNFTLTQWNVYFLLCFQNLGIKYELSPKGASSEQKAKLSKSTEAETKESKKTKRSSVAKKQEESDEETEKHILLVDSEDDEIEFKTPPHAVRKLKGRPKSATASRSLEKSSDRGTKKRLSATTKRPKMFQ